MDYIPTEVMVKAVRHLIKTATEVIEASGGKVTDEPEKDLSL
jgi:hypothetical protein